MRFTIDTDKKEIHLLNQVTFEDFMIQIKKMLPKGEWKQYKLDCSYSFPQYSQPIYQPSFVLTSGTSAKGVSSGSPYIPYHETGGIN